LVPPVGLLRWTSLSPHQPSDRSCVASCLATRVLVLVLVRTHLTRLIGRNVCTLSTTHLTRLIGRNVLTSHD
jgi:hypothetical protein